MRVAEDVPLSEILSEVSDAVALEEAALAMQLEDVAIPTTPLAAPVTAREGELTADAEGPRSGDVVADFFDGASDGTHGNDDAENGGNDAETGH